MNKILIVVDVQNGFVRYEQTKSVAEKIKSLVDKNYSIALSQLALSTRQTANTLNL